MIFVSGVSFSQKCLGKVFAKKGSLERKVVFGFGLCMECCGKSFTKKKKKKKMGDGPWFRSIFDRNVKRSFRKKFLKVEVVLGFSFTFMEMSWGRFKKKKKEKGFIFVYFGSGSIFTEMPKSK